MRRRVLLLTLLAAAASRVFAADFGMALGVVPKYGNENGFELAATATPWFSALVGERGSLFLSADCTLKADEDQTAFEFDVRRFQYRLAAQDGKYFDFGRFAVSDPSGAVVSGLLDGARMETAAGGGALRFGVYYSGLLNKDKNYVYLSAEDMADMADAGKFFAPSRVLAAAAYLRPNLLGESALAVEALGQFDLRSDGDALHSQYLVAGLKGPLAPALSYKAYAIASLVEETGESLALAAGFAADLSWLPPGERADKVYGRIRWGSGEGDSGGSAFVPVTANPQGQVFDPKLAGLLAAKGGYAARLSEKVSMDASACAYFKTGNGVSDAEVVYDSDSIWLGAEAFGSLRILPASDLSLSLGAGVFLPNAGGSFASSASPRWLATAAALISL